ncbi:MAG: GDP-mannose 4,6-dehydratase [Steroidobacteraceae bacterium]
MRALICGVSGQDGAYLCRFLHQRGYEVHGSSRDAEAGSFENLRRVGIYEHVVKHSMDSNDFRSVLQVLTRAAPDEIYSLAGQSSVGLSFEQPVETLESNSMGTLNLLEAMRILGKPIKLYSAGSGECFGDTNGEAANETTAFHPRSPYAIAKATAHWLVSNYREAYGLHASTGILFNHESPLRSRRFVTRKIVATACAIAAGSRERLTLGNLEIHRDWGWAPEYVEAMWLMLQQPHGGDFVIATGQQHSLAEFAAAAFSHLGLNWRDHTDSSPALYRPTDIAFSRGNAGKAAAVLGWRPNWTMAQVVRAMVDAERSGAATPS